MNTVELIRKKRFGGELTEQEIRDFIKGVTTGEIADYQISAMLMAICMAGMSDRETLALTLAMEKSGQTLSLKDIPGVKADKHSTGGVGDTTTLILVPLVAACGVKMAKMSGRGLGFTGGTLDKLESIPGFRVELPIEDFKRQVREIGCAVVGQNADLAPADKVLYALRDVTGTVDCMPLIVSSILSKKLAAGCDVVVLDVKYGSGALAGDARQAKELAEFMVRLGSMSGRKFSALVTGMEQPLGAYVGNALEVEEAIQVLSGQVQGDLKTVALELGAYILRNAGAVKSVQEGRALLNRKLNSGEGLKKLAAMIQAQGPDEAGGQILQKRLSFSGGHQSHRRSRQASGRGPGKEDGRDRSRGGYHCEKAHWRRRGGRRCALSGLCQSRFRCGRRIAPAQRRVYRFGGKTGDPAAD